MTFDVSRDGQHLGTYSEDGLMRRLNNGDILPTDLVFLEKQKRWAPISELPKGEVEEVAEFTQKITSATPVAFVTPALLAINIAVFLVMVIAGVPIMDPAPAGLIRWGADFGPLVTQGQWWRILTAAFVHVGLLHLAFNMWALLNAGVFVERLFGNTRFFTVYLLSAVGGNLASLVWQPHTVAAGASGAIFGIYGALIAFLVVQHKSIPPAAVASLGRNALAFVGYNILFGLNPASHIDMAAHLGGLLTGLLGGCALAYRAEGAAKTREVKRSLVVALIGFSLFVLAGMALRRGDARQTETYIAAVAGKNLTFGNNAHLVYSGSTTDADAKRLVEILSILRLSNVQNATILYTKNQAGSVVSLAVKEGAWQNPKMAPVFELWGRLISNATGTPLKLRLVDKQLQVKREFVYDGKVTGPLRRGGQKSQQ
jgi:membrane associated rhomboid family serine protease